MPFANFDVRNWYHALLAVGLLCLIGGAAFDLKNVDGKDAMVFGIGLMAIGFGEWMNHPFRSRIVQTVIGAGTASGHSRSNCVTGVVLVLFGLALVGFAGWRFALTF